MPDIPPEEVTDLLPVPTPAARAEIHTIMDELEKFRAEMIRLSESQQTATALRDFMEMQTQQTSVRLGEVERQLAKVSRAIAAATAVPRPAARLSKVVFVVYGAVLSYALYALADSIVIHGVLDAMHQKWPVGVVVDVGVRLMLFLPVLLFLVKQLGDVVMIETRFPAKRELRYLYEIVTASFYLTTFALLGRGSFLALLTFALVLLSNGTWCNELAKEYRHHPCKIAQLAKTLRTLHYIGGATFLVLLGGVWISRDPSKYDQIPAVRAIVAAAILAVFFVWYFFYERLPRKLHGPFVRRYLLSYVRLATRLRPKTWFGDGRVH